MKILSQRDPAWAALKLGASQLTIGRYGCTTTAMSMLTDYFGNYGSPAEIAAHKGWYTKPGEKPGPGLVKWTSLNFKAMKFARRLYGHNAGAIKASLQDPDGAVILEVANGSHWVVALGYDMLGRMKIADPWTGKRTNMSDYGNDITGSAHFIRR